MAVFSIQWRRAITTVALVFAFGTVAVAQERRFYSPPELSTVRAVPAERGMVVAQEKLAAQVGADILRKGGNAVDAAVATGFALAVTYPRAGNIGGGGFMVIHSAERNEDIAIDYRETAPAATTRDIFLGADGKPDGDKSRNSALGIGVPGTVAGLALALEKYGSGKFTLAQILKPSIELARNGFVVADDTADTLSDMYRRMSRWPNSAKTFSRDDGTHLQEGDRLVQADLAATLSAIADQGPKGFYEGPVAERLAKAVGNAGGIMTADDLKSYQAVIRSPVRGSYRGYDIVSMPLPSSGGTVLLETLNILEGFSMSEMKQGAAPSLHVMIEAMKRAYADRARYLGDPAFVNAPVNVLITKEYAARQRASIDLNRATPAADALSVSPAREGANTTHYSVVDFRGNAVSNTYTLNFPYGVGLVAEGTGVLLNNELDDFTAAPGAVQRLRAGRLRGQPARSRQATAVVDVTDHRAEGRQAGAGDRHARRQPHHLGGAADRRQRAGLQDGCRRRRGRPACASSMDAGRRAGGTRVSPGNAGCAEGQRSSRDRTARPDLRQFNRRHAQRLAGRPRSTYPRRGSGRAIAKRIRDCQFA